MRSPTEQGHQASEVWEVLPQTMLSPYEARKDEVQVDSITSQDQKVSGRGWESPLGEPDSGPVCASATAPNAMIPLCPILHDLQTFSSICFPADGKLHGPWVPCPTTVSCTGRMDTLANFHETVFHSENKGKMLIRKSTRRLSFSK